ncbi:hypothetical protein ROHU_014804 [Labeo rohita]|uniref:Uncharacterized protein n=1 Tax=Labeo rohita TaxID=84645 RepID=A0A498NT16_LABRO|nr:hypothetical protein ROHU_014804 [Labeo rohita]
MVLETEVKLRQRASEVELDNQRTEAEQVGQRTKVQPGGRWSQTEPKVQAGRRLTKAVLEGRGSLETLYG